MDLRGRRKGVLAGLGIALVLAIAPASASALQTITVTPDTGLSSPATVQVAGTGWAPSAKIGIRQCTGDNIFNPSDCTAPLVGVDADGAGRFGPVAVTVTRTFLGDKTGGTIDCGVTTCVIWAASSGATVDLTQKTIAFAPPGTSSAPSTDTGKRAVALQKCKQRAKKRDWSEKKLRKCKRRAKLLPA
jgi:Neocarzinostatin family